VASAGDDARARVFADQRRHFSSDRLEARVLFSRDQQDGHFEVRQAVMERVLGSRAEASKAIGEPFGCVLEARTKVRIARVEAGKERTGKPIVW
jgi:hypothetical protein